MKLMATISGAKYITYNIWCGVNITGGRNTQTWLCINTIKKLREHLYLFLSQFQCVSVKCAIRIATGSAWCVQLNQKCVSNKIGRDPVFVVLFISTRMTTVCCAWRINVESLTRQRTHYKAPSNCVVKTSMENWVRHTGTASWWRI